MKIMMTATMKKETHENGCVDEDEDDDESEEDHRNDGQNME